MRENEEYNRQRFIDWIEGLIPDMEQFFSEVELDEDSSLKFRLFKLYFPGQVEDILEVFDRREGSWGYPQVQFNKILASILCYFGYCTLCNSLRAYTMRNLKSRVEGGDEEALEPLLIELTRHQSIHAELN